MELDEVALAGAGYGDVTGVLAAESVTGERSYLVAFGDGDAREWLLLDVAGRPVSLTEMFASRPSLSTRASTRWYARAISCASPSFVISSPRTSIVASLPSPFKRRTTAIASSSVGPAMYGDASARTSGFGTAGRTRAIARSRSATGGGY